MNVIRSFFGRIQDFIICFQDLLTVRDLSQTEKLSEIESPLVDLLNLSLGRAFIYTTPQTMTPLWQAK